jgi:uncharacterized protein (TIGR02145 family)
MIRILKISCLFLILAFVYTCKKSKSPSSPTLTTTVISLITQTTAMSGGEILSDGGALVSVSGVCWSTSANPTTTLTTKTSDGTETGIFTSSLTGLTANTTYYVRSYATNSVATSYGNEVSFATLTTPTTQVSDIEGNIYRFITIGTQTWTAENLKTTRNNDGTTIPLITDNTAWANLTSPGYCWNYNDVTTYKATYGALYNWYSISTGKLCPIGWHVPTDEEWTTLTNYLGDNAGGKLKEAGAANWRGPNIGATNESGFTALPGGGRQSSGQFIVIGYTSGNWWSSTEYSTNAWFRSMSNGSTVVSKYYDSKQDGYSVRCIRDY